MKILVLGGAGFIGQNLVEALHNEHQVYSLLHTRFPKLQFDNVRYISYVDLTNELLLPYLKLNQYDVIIQAAAVTTSSKDTVERPHIHITDNVIMNSLILRQLYESKFKGHFIFFSCGVMYDPNIRTPQTEANLDANGPIHDSYFGIAHTKLYIEKMMQFFSKLGGFKCTSIRNSNIYGPYDKFNSDKGHLIPSIISKVLIADTHIDVWGDGKGSRDVVYVGDLVTLVQKVISSQDSNFEIFNCSSGHTVDINYLINYIVWISNKKLSVKYNNKISIPTNISMSNRKAQTMLGWFPNTSLSDGLAKTIEWVKNEERNI